MTLQRKIFSIMFVVALALLAGFVFYFVFLQSGINSGLDQVTANATALFEQELSGGASFPVRLKIPQIGVDAAIEYVGITKTGMIGVSSGPVNAAWFNGSVRPGEKGSAIIDGHFGWHGGIPAVFDNLYKLKIGDKVYVEDKNGATITFVVRKIKKYDPKADASVLFNSSDGKSHLNLVTCSGTWNPVEKTHSSRLVVFTDKE
jgi:LPXTG-site transpeptidase (sortase) family protein